MISYLSFSGVLRKVVISVLTVPIWEKANLSLEEAAAYYGIGINKLRALTYGKIAALRLFYIQFEPFFSPLTGQPKNMAHYITPAAAVVV